MIVYEVVTELSSSVDAAAYERYMRERHIPDLLETGCFGAARFERAEGRLYRASYHAASRGELERYLAEHADRLRGDVGRHFPEGLSASRRVWDQLQVWP
jgi:hypothetical protein